MSDYHNTPAGFYMIKTYKFFKGLSSIPIPERGFRQRVFLSINKSHSLCVKKKNYIYMSINYFKIKSINNHNNHGILNYFI